MPYVGVGLDEGVLRQVVAELRIAQRLAEEEPPDGRLIFHDKRVERLLVVKNGHPRNQRYVIKLFHLLPRNITFLYRRPARLLCRP